MTPDERTDRSAEVPTDFDDDLPDDVLDQVTGGAPVLQEPMVHPQAGGVTPNTF